MINAFAMSFKGREVNTMIGNIIRHMTPDRAFENSYPQVRWIELNHFLNSCIELNCLGQWLVHSPMASTNQVRDPVVAYLNCSSRLLYNSITRVRQLSQLQ